MAVKTQPIVADTGSEEVTLTRQQYNNLVNVIDALFAAIAASSDASGIKTGAAAIDRSALRQLIATHELPTPPLFPTQG